MALFGEIYPVSDTMADVATNLVFQDMLALSCADKASNLNDTNRLNAGGYAVEVFISRGHSSQLDKFVSLDRMYRGKVAESIYSRFRAALNTFESSGY